MRIVTLKTIVEFSEKHPDVRVALQDWYYTTKNSDWNNITDIRSAFNTVDYVGNNRYVFNIRGNNYRLVTIIIFASKKVYIRFIGTHQEYDKTDCSNI